MIFLIQLIHLLLLSRLPFSAFPEFYIFPYLAASGWTPYSQVIDQHFPGLLFFPLNFYLLGFRTAQTFRYLYLGVVLTQSVLIFLLARKYVSRYAANLSAFLFLLWQPFFSRGQLWFETFIPLFTLPAVWFLLQGQLFLAGFFLGLAILIKQSAVLLLLPITIWLGTRLVAGKPTLILRFFFGLGIPLIILVTYLLALGVLPQFIYWTGLFNLSVYAQTARNFSGSALIPTTVPGSLTLIAFWSLRQRPLALVLSVCLVLSFIGDLTRLDLVHFQAAIPFYCLLVGYWLSTRSKLYRPVLSISVILITLGWTSTYFLRTTYQAINLYATSATLDLARTITTYVPPQNSVLLLGLQPHLYTLTHTFPPGRLFLYQLPWYFQIAGQKQLNALTQSPPRYIFVDWTATVDHQPATAYLSSLIPFIGSHYRAVAEVAPHTYLLEYSRHD